jgi:two-component system response regulator WspF
VKVAIVHKAGVQLAPLERALAIAGHDVLWTSRDPVTAQRLALSEKVEVVLWTVDASRGERALQALRDTALHTPIVAMYRGEHELGDADTALASGASLALDLTKLQSDGPGELHARLDAARRLSLRRSLPARALGSLVAIGASTGGPQALAQLCGSLPADFAGALIVVQHIEPSFASTLVDSLAQQTSLHVCAAVEGAAPQAGSVCLAAEPGHHLVLRADLRFHYTREPAYSIHRPSIDVLFESLAQHWSKRGTAVLLTGMGRDGAHGMAVLRSRGWRTIAQDESSSVVYGMPRAARDLGGASEVLDIAQIGPALLRRAR